MIFEGVLDPDVGRVPRGQCPAAALSPSPLCIYRSHCFFAGAFSSHHISIKVILIMDSSFETLYSSPCQNPPKRSRSPRFLTTVKDLHKSLSIIRSRGAQRKHPLHDSSCPASQDGSVKQMLWKRRGQTSGMDDYLTLAQLENAWHKQDSYVGCVIAPQKITQYTFQEAVEAPLIADHTSSIHTRRHQGPRLAPDLNGPLPSPPQGEVTTFIDGALHPALRPSPYLADNPPAMTQHNVPLRRLATEVPDTNWTYGRD